MAITIILLISPLTKHELYSCNVHNYAVTVFCHLWFRLQPAIIAIIA
jgi:hypothetical protein